VERRREGRRERRRERERYSRVRTGRM